MSRQSMVIRGWLGEPPYVFATADRKKYDGHSSADREFAGYLAPAAAERRVIDVSALGELRRSGKTITGPLVVLHPHREQDCELLRQVVAAGSVARMFVIIWSPRDMVRAWLDGLGAVDLHTGAAIEAPDAVQLEAARCWVDEQYNGLSSGNGKAAVVQLLRVFTCAGYPLNADTWLRAYFAAGGTFRHAAAVVKFITEMQNGTQHRIKDRYVPDILTVLRERTTRSVAR